MSPDSFLARALLASGMLARNQLEIALKWLEESPAGGLGDLLVTNGVLPRATYESLMRFYKKDTSRVGSAPATGNRDRGVREAQLYCLVAMRENEATAEQVRDSIDQWVRLEGMGKPRPIGEVMMEKGYLDLVRMRMVAGMMKESSLGCSACGEVDFLYKVNGSPFSCDKCKGPLNPRRIKGSDAGPVTAKDPLIGTMVGGFRIDEKIGQGRWSVVYKGLIPAQNRPAAAKVFAAEAPISTVARWVEAAKRSIPVLHAALVGVVEAGMKDGRGFMVTELVTDGRRWPEREKMNWRLACKVGIDLARALGAIHATGMAHGDVRPSSVLIRESGAKLMDAGLAHDGTLSVPCDPLITAPEMWKNDPLDPVKTDLYALGITMFIFVAGRAPYDAADPRQLDISHRMVVPKPPGTYNLELPRALSAIVMRLLEKDPNNRYGFCEEVARDFESVLRGDTPAAAGNQESRNCSVCNSPNPATEVKCIVCGKPLADAGDLLLLDGEAPCPQCHKPLAADAKKCACGYTPCVMCRVKPADAEFGYCSSCLTPEVAAQLKAKQNFRSKPKLGRPSGPMGLKPPPPPITRNLKPAPPATKSFKPAPPPLTGKLKPPPPPVDDDLDFESLPPPSEGAAPAGGEDDLDFDNLPPPPAKPGSDDDLLGSDPPPPKGPPPPIKPKSSLMDRRRR